MAVTIHILEGESGQTGQELSLAKTTILIGRGDDQDVRLTNDSVSRRHCVIEKRDGQWRIIDEGSHNGTYVNGQKVIQTRAIRHEDVIEIGEVMFRVGLDRQLRDPKSSRAAPAVPIIVRAITIFILGLAVLLAGTSMFLLWRYQGEMGRVTSRLPVKLGAAESRLVFPGSPDERDLTFQWLAAQPGWMEADTSFYDNPLPNWNLNNVWSTQLAGNEPRLFEGLDLDLIGGGQVVCSGYFFAKRQWVARDATDPVGMVYMEIEGWSGFGERYADKRTLPVLRRPELPRYTRSLTIYPENVREISHGDWRDVELTNHSRMKQLVPPMLDASLAPLQPARGERIVTLMAPKPQPANARMDARHYTFFLDGNRYAVTVGGTANMFENRYEGGIDAVAQAIVGSIKIEPTVSRPTPPADQIQLRIKEKTTMLIAASRKPIILEAITYPDLMGVRDLLLTLQQSPKPVDNEDELRRLYFATRHKTQDDLLISATKIYDGRRDSKAPEGERELLRIRQFMANYPPLTMKWGDLGYPEWSMYYESVVDIAPYTTMKQAERR
jgi:hypothetical protein